MNNKYKRLLSDTALFGISNFASKVISFLLIPLYTSKLTTADYGVSDLIQTTVNFLYPFLTLSISEATIRFAFEKKNNVLSTSLLFIFVSTIILLLASPLVSKINLELSQFWGYFIVYYFCFNIHYCLSQYTRGCDKTRLFAIQGIIQTCTVILSNIVFLVFLNTGIKGYLLSFIIGYIIAIFLMLIKGNYWGEILCLNIDKPLIKEMLRYSIPMIPTQIFWWINNAADKWIIIANVGMEENGIYSVAHKIPTILTMLTSIFNQAFQLSAFSNYKEKDNSDFFSKVYHVFWLLNVFTCTILISGSELLGRILFANDFYRGWTFVPVLLVASVFNGLSGMLASAFTSAKKNNVLFISTGIGAVCNIILNLIFIDIFGSMGAAYATAISCMLVWGIRIIQTQKCVCIKVNYFKHIIAILALVGQVYLTSNHIFNIWIVGVVTVLFLFLIYAKEIFHVSNLVYKKIRLMIKYRRGNK